MQIAYESSVSFLLGQFDSIVESLLLAHREIGGTLALMDLLFQLTRVGALWGRRIYVLGIRQHLIKMMI